MTLSSQTLTSVSTVQNISNKCCEAISCDILNKEPTVIPAPESLRSSPCAESYPSRETRWQLLTSKIFVQNLRSFSLYHRPDHHPVSNYSESFSLLPFIGRHYINYRICWCILCNVNSHFLVAFPAPTANDVYVFVSSFDVCFSRLLPLHL